MHKLYHIRLLVSIYYLERDIGTLLNVINTASLGYPVRKTSHNVINEQLAHATGSRDRVSVT